VELLQFGEWSIKVLAIFVKIIYWSLPYLTFSFARFMVEDMNRKIWFQVLFTRVYGYVAI
jgi:hypothetical protein